MTLITRLTRLFRADFHAVLDRIEEPDVLLKQAVREMTGALAEDERRLQGLLYEQRQIDTRHSELAQSLCESEGALDVCFAAGQDDLARAQIQKQLETQQHLKALTRQRESLAQTLAASQIRVRENRARLAAMQQKMAVLTEEAVSTSGVWTSPETPIRREDVEVAFLREKQRRVSS